MSSIIEEEVYKVEDFYMSEATEHWCSMREIMVHFGVSRDTVLTWIDKKNMPATKMGRLWKFKISEVDAWAKAGDAADK